jgi:hypothetical protein
MKPHSFIMANWFYAIYASIDLRRGYERVEQPLVKLRVKPELYTSASWMKQMRDGEKCR